MGLSENRFTEIAGLNSDWRLKMPTSIHSEKYLTFRKLLTEQRRKAGLTQADVARRLDKPQSYVSKYEQGERRLDVIEFIDVASAIGFDPAKLIKKL